jgi:hypothetical protein
MDNQKIKNSSVCAPTAGLESDLIALTVQTFQFFSRANLQSDRGMDYEVESADKHESCCELCSDASFWYFLNHARKFRRSFITKNGRLKNRGFTREAMMSQLLLMAIRPRDISTVKESTGAVVLFPIWSVLACGILAWLVIWIQSFNNSLESKQSATQSLVIKVIIYSSTNSSICSMWCDIPWPFQPIHK